MEEATELLLEVILKAIHSNLPDMRSTVFFQTLLSQATNMSRALVDIAESISYLKCSDAFGPYFV